MGDEIRDRKGRFAGSRRRAVTPKPPPPPAGGGPAGCSDRGNDVVPVFQAFQHMTETAQREGSGSWLSEMRPGQAVAPLGTFNAQNFGVLLSAVSQVSAEKLCEHDSLSPEIVGVDDSWRMVRIVEGPSGTRPTWLCWHGQNVVRVAGSPIDHIDVAREVFRKLNIRAAYLVTEKVTDKGNQGDGMESEVGVGTPDRECVVDGIFMPSGNRRVMVVPVKSRADTLVAGPVEDSSDLLPGVFLGTSPLAACFD